MGKNYHNAQIILLLRTSDACYNILNLFIDELAKTLRACGQLVEVLDITKGNHPLKQYINRHFKAIICIQTNFINSFDRKNI